MERSSCHQTMWRPLVSKILGRNLGRQGTLFFDFELMRPTGYWLRVAEVLAVDLENGTAELWYYLRSRQHSTKKWHEPLVLSPHHPYYYDERSPGTSHLKPKKDKIPHLRRRKGQVDKADVEIVVPYFLLETAGKVPRKVCAAADEYLRRQYKAGADIARRALFPPRRRRAVAKATCCLIATARRGQMRLAHSDIG